MLFNRFILAIIFLSSPFLLASSLSEYYYYRDPMIYYERSCYSDSDVQLLVKNTDQIDIIFNLKKYIIIDYAKENQLEYLDDGSYSLVYSNHCKLLAYKFLLKHDPENEYKKAVFKNEINILKKLAQIKNEYIVIYYDFKYVEDIPCLIFEYLPSNLHNLIKEPEYKKFSEGLTRKISKRIARGLLVLEEQRILHRDLKPENILLNDFFCPKICDFGLAVEMEWDELQEEEKPYSSDRLVGTLPYIPPEMFYEHYDEKGNRIFPYYRNIDWWQFGCILFEMLTYTDPFNPSLFYNREFEFDENTYQIMIILGSEPLYELVENEEIVILLKALLEKDHTKRISIKEALEFDFFN